MDPDNWLQLAKKVFLQIHDISRMLTPTGIIPENEFARQSHCMCSTGMAVGIAPDRAFQSNRSEQRDVMPATASGIAPPKLLKLTISINILAKDPMNCATEFESLFADNSKFLTSVSQPTAALNPSTNCCPSSTVSSASTAPELQALSLASCCGLQLSASSHRIRNR